MRLAYRFAHELVRRALYDGLTGLRRAELHLRVGEALEAGRRRAGAAELAHHFTAAAPLGRDRARHRLQRARRARGGARRWPSTRRPSGWRLALELGVDEPAERAELLIELGLARHRAGRAVDALAAFAQAAEIARRAGAAGARRDRLRGRVLAPGDHRPSRRRAARAGGRGARRGAVAAARRRARRPRPRAADPRRARARRRRARGGDRDGPRASATAPRWPACSSASYWSRETDLARARCSRRSPRRATSPTELGDVELRTEAMNWRVAALMAAVRHRGGAPRGRRRARDRRAHRAAVPSPRRRALRLGDRAVRGPAGRRRGDGRALARVEPAADRPRRLGRATGSRCSASGASRAGSPSSRR